MLLKPFEIVFAESVEDASSALARLGDEALVYSGGVELVLLARLGFVEAGYLVDVKGIPGIGDLSNGGPAVRIGATVTHRRVHTDPLVNDALPLLARAAGGIGNVRIRNQGTLGGNVCFCDPHSDPTAPLLVYEATVVAESARGRRELPFDEFVVGPYETALEPDEIVTSVSAQGLPGWGQHYIRFARFERPTVNTAVAVRTENGTIAEARVAVGCLGPRARRLGDLEARLQGVRSDEASRIVAESRSYLAETLAPSDDLLGSADYKLQLASVLVGRALDAALEASA